MLTEKELGERLKNVRKMRNISQFRMADMMGTEQSFIREGRCISYMPTYQYIAEALGVTVGTLLGETGGAE